MADFDETSQDAAPAAAIPPAFDQERLSALENYYAQTHPFLSKIEPFYDDVQKFIEDEDRRNYTKKSWEFFEKAKSEQEAVDPQFDKIAQYIDKKLERTDKYVEKLEQTEAQIRASAEQKAYQENLAYAQRLQQSDFKDDPAALQDLIKFAGANGYSVEDAYKRVYGRAKPAADEASDRGDRGRQEIPPKRQADEQNRWQSDFHGALIDRIKAAQRAS